MSETRLETNHKLICDSKVTSNELKILINKLDEIINKVNEVSKKQNNSENCKCNVRHM